MTLHMTEILARLQSQDSRDQLSALAALLADGQPAAVPHVMGVLHSPNSAVREMGARYLGHFAPQGDQHVGDALLPLLDDEDELVRAEVATALGLLEYVPALPRLQGKALHDPEELVRVAAIEALAHFPQVDLFAVFARAVRDDASALVQRYAADAIRTTAKVHEIEDIKQLAELRHDEPIIAIHLFLAAYKLGDSASLTQILLYLRTVADLDDLFYLVHVIAAHYTGPLSSAIIADIPKMIAGLRELAQRIPDMRAPCDELQRQLAEIQRGKIITAQPCC